MATYIVIDGSCSLGRSAHGASPFPFPTTAMWMDSGFPTFGLRGPLLLYGRLLPASILDASFYLFFVRLYVHHGSMLGVGAPTRGGLFFLWISGFVCWAALEIGCVGHVKG